MFLFRLKLYWRTLMATWRTFGLSKPLLVYALRRPILSGTMRLLMLLDYVFFPAFRRVAVRRPLFIIGHPRSGTTFLHRLLNETREFCMFETWEILIPSLLGRKLLRGTIRRLIQEGKGSLLPKEAGHEGALGEVEEEELLFMHNTNTQFVTCLSPLAFSDWDFAELVYADQQPEPIRRRSMAFLKGCFQRQIYGLGAPQVVAKMNYSGMRIRSLLEAFPDAKIVYVVRSPLETIPSHLTLHRNMFREMWGLERIPPHLLRRYYERRYRYNVAFYRYLEDVIQKGDIPCDRLLVLPYEELRRDPAGSVRKVADFSGIPISTELQQRIENQGREQPSYQRRHKNLGLEEFGLTREQVVADLQFVFDKYGFEK